MVDPKNGKGGFKEFAKHEKSVVNAASMGVTGAAAPTPVVVPIAPKPDGDRKVPATS